MKLGYLVRRLTLFFIVLFLATSLNFFLPRLSGQDPIRYVLNQEQITGGAAGTSNIEAMVKTFDKRFGLTKPLIEQYALFLRNAVTLHFGQSIAYYPTPVTTIIGKALPWSVGLLLTSTVFATVIGTLLGAIASWDKAPGVFKGMVPIFFTFSAVPYFLLGLVLVYLLGFVVSWFPIFGGFQQGTIPSMSFHFWLDVLHHSILPGLSIVVAQIGFWALGMRAMMVTMEGEDYMIQAEAKGLRNARIFLRYAVRNAILPQTTAFSLSLAHIVSGAILVEVVFQYPGIGNVLLNAIKGSDFPVIEGIVFLIILGVAGGMLLMDLVYPFLDPRITQRS